MKAKRTQGNTTLGELDELILKFLQARDWDNLPPRALAISIALEANELLEHYQWHEDPIGDREALADELADVFICAFEFAQVMDIDVAEAVKNKLAKNGKKYPADHFKDKGESARRQAWLAAKMKHRKNNL